MARTKQSCRGYGAPRVQCWKIVNLDTAEALDASHTLRHMLGIADPISGQTPKMEWGFISQRYPPSFDDLLAIGTPERGVVARVSSLTSASHRGTLARMPTELLKSVFDWIENIVDAISLCISCRFFLNVGHDSCISRIAKTTGFWTGARIACIRDSIPEAYTTLVGANENTAAWVTDGPESINLMELYRDLGTANPLPSRTSLPDYEGLQISATESRLFDRFFDSAPKPAIPWALCNISKRHYVVVKNGGRVELGQILVSQICWCPSPGSRRWEGAAERGKWVGDRVEITTLDRLRAGQSDWIDVSKEVLGEMRAIKRPSSWS